MEEKYILKEPGFSHTHHFHSKSKILRSQEAMLHDFKMKTFNRPLPVPINGPNAEL